ESATILAVPHAEPSTELAEHPAKVGIPLEAPTGKPRVDLRGADLRILIERRLRPAGGRLHQQEADNGDEQDDRDCLNAAANDVAIHALDLLPGEVGAGRPVRSAASTEYGAGGRPWTPTRCALIATDQGMNHQVSAFHVGPTELG